MASIGLTVHSPTVIPLSKLFGSFGEDQKLRVQAELAASQVAAREAYIRKLAVDAGLVRAKTAAEEAKNAALADAEDPVSQAYGAAIPVPAPVEVNPRLPPPDIARYPGPTPIAVDTDWAATKALRDKADIQRRGFSAIGRASVYGSDPTRDFLKAQGGGALIGDMNQPGIVDPQALRSAGFLYSGNAPTTTTVTTEGDVAGVNAARDASIVHDIAVEGSKPIIVDGVAYTQNADGSLTEKPGQVPQTDEAHEARLIGAVDARLKNGQPVDDELMAIYQAIKARRAPKDVLKVGKDERVFLSNPADPTKPTQIIGPEAAAGQSGPFAATGLSGDDARIVNRVWMAFVNGTPISEPDALAYNDVVARNYGVTYRTGYDNTGKPYPIQEQKNAWPEGMPTPQDIGRRAGLYGAGGTPAAPVQPPAPAAVAAPAAAGATWAGNPSQPPAYSPPKIAGDRPTEAQGRTAVLIPPMAKGSSNLDNMPPEHLPGPWQQFVGNPSSGSSLFSLGARTYLANDWTKEYYQAVTSYASALNYLVSGAAIQIPEYERAIASDVPVYGEPEKARRDKQETRHLRLLAGAHNMFPNDPEKEMAVIMGFIDNYGFDFRDVRPDLPAPLPPPPPDVSPEQWPLIWPDLSPEAKAEARRLTTPPPR